MEARTEPEKQPESPTNTDVSTEVRKPNFKEFDNQTSRNSETELAEVRKSNFMKFDNQTSRGSETELAEVREPNGNYNNNNYNNMSYNNPINLSIQGDAVQAAQEDDAMDGMDEVWTYVKTLDTES